MGGPRGAFLTTHWSLIEDVKQDPDQDRALIGLLIKRYWKPVYCYVRRKGHGNEQAKDLTQGFLHEVVLNRHLIDRADSAKGRFRSLLLHALNQYLVDEQRKEGAYKRMPKDKVVPLAALDSSALPQVVDTLNAEQGFNYMWKAELLERVLAEVKERCTQREMTVHWQLFQDRLLAPTLQGHDPPSLLQLCERYGIDKEATASNMISTVKKRVRSVLEAQVRQTVVSDQAAREELQEFFPFLEKDGQS